MCMYSCPFGSGHLSLCCTVSPFFLPSFLSFSRLVSGPDGYMGVVCGDVTITYKMIQQDIRAAMHWVHTEVGDVAVWGGKVCVQKQLYLCSCLCVYTQGNLKQRTLDDLPRYVKKEPRLPLFLHRLVEKELKEMFQAQIRENSWTKRHKRVEREKEREREGRKGERKKEKREWRKSQNQGKVCGRYSGKR